MFQEGLRQRAAIRKANRPATEKEGEQAPGVRKNDLFMGTASGCSSHTSRGCQSHCKFRRGGGKMPGTMLGWLNKPV